MITHDFSIYEKLPELQEIANHQVYVSNKFEKFAPDGFYSEQIFGPVKNYRCQCGNLFGKINAGKRCKSCGVLCVKSDLRSMTFAKIKLPANIHIINPDFIGTLEQIFGSFAIKNLLNSKNFNENRDNPYFFSIEKQKLIRKSKLREDEEYLDFEVFDITTLKKLYDYLYEEEYYNKLLKTFVNDERILKFIFLNEIPVLPPDSRPIIMINTTKMMPHAITTLYIKILTSKKNISDNLFQENSQLFGFTVYKYQNKIIEIYDKIAENNFKKKESYIREALTGKTVEFSQRSVIVPNPALKPYQLGFHRDAVEKIFLPELLRFLFEKFENENIDDINISVSDYLQYILKNINYKGIRLSDELFLEFLKEKAKDFTICFERQPVLWKFNTSVLTLGRVFGDNDLFKKENKENKGKQ